MDDYTAETFVNRDDPIPVVPLDHDLSDEVDSDALQNRKRDRLRKHTANAKENTRKATSRSSESTRSYVQDRLLEK